MTEENHEKTRVRLVDTGIRTRDLPNASLVRYHGATALGNVHFFAITNNWLKNKEKKKIDTSRLSPTLHILKLNVAHNLLV